MDQKRQKHGITIFTLRSVPGYTYLFRIYIDKDKNTNEIYRNKSIDIVMSLCNDIVVLD